MPDSPAFRHLQTQKYILREKNPSKIAAAGFTREKKRNQNQKPFHKNFLRQVFKKPKASNN
jgi:hypothetical protein